jgi:hypothetical protein
MCMLDVLAVGTGAWAQDPCPDGAMVDGECLSADETAARHAAGERPPASASATAMATRIRER